MVPDQFSHLLEEIHKLETELGHLPQKWKVLWDKLELPNTDSLAVSCANAILLRGIISYIYITSTFYVCVCRNISIN